MGHLFCAEPMTPQCLDLGPDRNGRHRLTGLLDCTIAGLEDGWVVAWFWTLEAGLEMFVWTGECHTRVDTHIVLNRYDPSEVLHTTFDLIIGKKPPFRLWVALEKGYDELPVCLL